MENKNMLGKMLKEKKEGKKKKKGKMMDKKDMEKQYKEKHG